MNDTMEAVHPPDSGTHESDVNVGTAERVASGLIGAAIAGYGLSRKSLLGTVLALVGGDLMYRGISGHCHVYQALDVDTSGRRDGEDVISQLSRRGIKVDVAMTITRPVEDLYLYWRNFENLPQFMRNVESVTVADERRSHWVITGPAGRQLEWDAEIIEDIEYMLIGWYSLPGADVDNAGIVMFTPAPGDRGTEVRVVMLYDVPGGKLGATVSKLLGHDPDLEVREDLRCFKRMMETGQIPSTDGQPQGGRAADEMPEEQTHFAFGSRDIVDQAAWESFPASDAPAY